VQLNTGNNGHHSTSRSSSSSHLQPPGGAVSRRWVRLAWWLTGSDRMQETLAQHLGQPQKPPAAGQQNLEAERKESSSIQPVGSR